MILLALLIGFVLGGLTATAACALWAFHAMHPHELPKTEFLGYQPPPTDPPFRFKTAEELASEVERYAVRAAKRAEGIE